LDGRDVGPRPQTRAPAAHGRKAHLGQPHKHALGVLERHAAGTPAFMVRMGSAGRILKALG
jgi:hypothetical protein